MFPADTACFFGKPIPVRLREWVFFMRVPKPVAPLVPFLLTFFLMSAPILSCGEETPDPASSSPPPTSSQTEDVPSHTAEDLEARLSESDVVVLGTIDACWVCQFSPRPRVQYTKILAGDLAGGSGEGQLDLAGVADTLLPPSGVPIYKSRQEEICFLKKATVKGFKGTDFYKVVDVWEATPPHLNLFSDQPSNQPREE